MTTDILALADKHEQAYGAFIRMDTLEHPEPPAPKWYQGLPFLMLPFSVVALAGIALSALRTGPVFQRAAEPVVGKDFALIEAVLAVIITELFLVVTRYVLILVRARDGRAVHNIDSLMLVGFWLAFGVALFANLYANVGELPFLAPVKPAIDLVVGILVAISAPVLAFICGDILAVLWLQSERHRAEMQRQFGLLMEEFKAARERRWNAQKARYGVRLEPVPALAAPSIAVNLRQLTAIDRPTPKMKKAIAWLMEHPEDMETESRALAARIGVSHTLANEAKKIVMSNGGHE